MSYCRWENGDSDIYVYKHVDGYWECMRCALTGGAHHDSSSAEEMLAHMREHVSASHRVPSYAIRDIQGEIAELTERKP